MTAKSQSNGLFLVRKLPLYCSGLRGLYHAPVIPAGFRSFLRIPVDSGGIKFGGGPCQISIPGTPYSGGIELFRNLDRNGPRNGPERNPAECNKILILLVNLTRD